MKQARNSFGKPYDCKKDWPYDCFVQCGTNGLVIDCSIKDALENINPLKKVVDNVTRVTAFFEAFPREPDTFIRGEGSTVEEAEQSAWEKYERIIACAKHEFERKGYKNGGGICKHCKLFTMGVFEPSEHCTICGKPTYFTQDMDDNWYCEEHKSEMPEDKKPEWMKRYEVKSEQ